MHASSSFSPMSRLDEFLPVYDVVERHQRHVPALADAAVAAALAAPVAPDGLVRTLFRLRGLHGGGTVDGAVRGLGFAELVHEPDCVVVGAAGRPWKPRGGGLVPFDKAGAGQIRMLLEVSATPDGTGSLLYTETRVAAMDAGSRRAFRRYWHVVGPFSGLIRTRWLAAAERALR
jgi:hypothetical protein